MVVVALTAGHFSLGFGVFVLYTDTLLCLLINSLFSIVYSMAFFDCVLVLATHVTGFCE